jgi:predicted acylesterase/phospholipase RssA
MTQATNSQNKLDPNVCDVIMKGGVTSGVVYPKAIVRLSEAYRFYRIGGTSAGAIAAAATAAAQYRKNRTADLGGFKDLENLPDELGRTVNGESLLQRLFQPQWTVGRLFKVLLSGLNSRRPRGWIVIEAIRGFAWFALPWAYPGLILLTWALYEGGAAALQKRNLQTLFTQQPVSWQAILWPVGAALLTVIVLSLGMALASGLAGRMKPPGEIPPSSEDQVWNWSMRLLGVILLIAVVACWPWVGLDIQYADYLPLAFIVAACVVFLMGSVWAKGKSVVAFVGWHIIVPGLAGIALLIATYQGMRQPDAVQLFSILFYALLTIAGFLFGLGLNIVIRLVRRLPENNFGLCNGSFPESISTDLRIPPLEEWGLNRYKNSAEAVLPLTHWMEAYFNRLAYGDAKAQLLWAERKIQTNQALTLSLTAHPDTNEGKYSPPLTFAELEQHHVLLHLKTTNLSQQIACSIPFQEDDLYYCPVELELLFPDNVMSYLDDYESKHPSVLPAPPPPAPNPNVTYRRLPPGNDLPIIIGVRMSLSFPILLSAIKLYKVLNGKMTPCWFTDGGITSNFPISLFDDPLPACPTFAIDLIPPDGLKRHSLPNDDQTLNPLWWYFGRSNQATSSLGWQPAVSDLFAFLNAIFDTARNWRDNSYVTLPGYRDRVTRVHVPADSGGLNLTMPVSSITELAQRGEDAATELRDRFTGLAGHPMNWEHHKWIRFRAFMTSFDQMAVEYHTKFHEGNYSNLIANYPTVAAGISTLGSEWTTKQKTDATTTLNEVLKTFKQWPSNSSPFQANAPVPETILRSRPKE